MSETKETQHLELKRKSKKIKKSYNLLDFVVVKKKNKKTQQVSRVKVAKLIVKRGKARKKKVTTIKKRILKERRAKHDAPICQSETTQLSSSVDVENVIDKLAQVQLHETHSAPSEIADDSSTQITRNETQSKSSLNQVQIDLQIGSSQPSVGSVQHSRNFREYCNHFITQEIKHFTELALKDLFKFQENKFQQNPIKAKANKRYVVGFKEVKKFLVVKRLKLVIIAPDLERNSEVDRVVEEIKALANEHNIPYVFSIKRRHIGYLLLKKVPVSCLGIFDYQGTTENVTELLKHVQQERISYRNKTVIVS